MKIGFPTYPRNSMVDEIHWIGHNGFDFSDLFFEADRAEKHQIDPAGVRRALDEYGLDAVGHTAWYLPIGSPSKPLHDNNGQADLHLPMGVGRIRWDHLIRTLKSCYDGTITPEIFAPDNDYVLLARKKLLEKWKTL